MRQQVGLLGGGRTRALTPAALPRGRLVVRRAAQEVVASGGEAATSTSGRAPSAAAPPAARPPAPRSIHEISNGNILGFGADLTADHPGFHDADYKRRRIMIAQMAQRHRIGEPIPPVEYSPQEVEVWALALHQLKDLLPQHACSRYLDSFPKMGFREDRVPQLQEVSEVLQQQSGWTVRPVAGLMHPRDFLNGLAFKYFHSTQYMRHPSRPSYTPEPDVVHELIGHVPMLADPGFSAMVQAIGRASLNADEKQIWHLTKVYWYTVEFGVVRENGKIKAFGAGILSSFGELEHMASGGATLEEFNPFAPQPKMSYKDGYQKRYFVMDSFEDGTAKLLDYASTMILPEDLRGPVYPRG